MRRSHTLTSHLQFGQMPQPLTFRNVQKICGGRWACKNGRWNLQQYMGETQAAIAKRKKHSRVEIATKLARANDLATQGKLQSEIARTLGVSVMTLHRWRKALASDRIAELESRKFTVAAIGD